MALDTTSSRTRSITAIGAGAVLFAVVGYFLLNKKGKKAKTSLEMHPPKDHLDETLEDKCLHSPVEASSPVITEHKFFTEKFEISIEKSIETNLVVNQPPAELSPSSTISELSSESANLSNVEKVMEQKEIKVKPESKKAEPVAKSKKSKSKQAKSSEAKAETKSGEKIFEDFQVPGQALYTNIVQADHQANHLSALQPAGEHVQQCQGAGSAGHVCRCEVNAEE